MLKLVRTTDNSPDVLRIHHSHHTIHNKKIKKKGEEEEAEAVTSKSNQAISNIFIILYK